MAPAKEAGFSPSASLGIKKPALHGTALTTTDFAEWRDWRQVCVVISRRGHDISCPYAKKEKKDATLPGKNHRDAKYAKGTALRRKEQDGAAKEAGFRKPALHGTALTTTDFAEWRDWRQVRVVISRRGHDISCPYTRKEKKMPPFPVKITGTPRQIGRGKRHARKGRRYEGKSAGGTPALQRKAKSQSKDWPLPETENGRVRAGVHGLRLSHFSGRIRML